MRQSNALISIDQFKDWFALVEDTSAVGELADSLIEGWINSASDRIERWCGRVFRKATLTDEAYDGNGLGFFRVRRPPVLSFTSLKVLYSSNWTETIAATDYTWKDNGTVTLTTGTILSMRRFPAGVNNVLASYVGGYTAIPQPVQDAAILVVAQDWYRRAADPARANETAAGFGKMLGPVHASGLPMAAIEKLQDYKLSRISRAGQSGSETVWL